MAHIQDGKAALKSEINGFTGKVIRDFRKNKLVYLMVLPVVVYYIIFHYGPMYGLQIAFKDYSPGLGFLKSPWVGFKHFTDFFQSIFFLRVFRNTILLSVYDLIFGFPAPIILALLLNELRSIRFKRVVQTVSYIPYFISAVVICGMIKDFTLSDGLINDVIVLFGGERSPILQEAGKFRSIFVSSNIWQGVGWGSVIYIAALAGIDQEIYQAAIIDGAGRFRRIWHVSIPGILPTVIILLILSIGHLLSVSFEKIILLYNPSIYETADVISSYVYRKGIQQFNFSFSSAIGFFNSVLNFILLVMANYLSKKFSETSLW
ncbi:MAG: sugar ABC transporter permease [Clostridiales bacterium GWC2_40_7]|nr:MAG: sugar ABC transporter permease [Clostridiales bacterium GWC2_40_7]